MKKFKSAAFSLLACSLVLAGCSGKSPQAAPLGSTAAPTSAPTTTAAPSLAPTAAAPTTVQPAAPLPAPTAPPATAPSQHNISSVGGITYIDGVIIANKTYNLPKDYNPGVNPEAADAFSSLQNGASADGLQFWIASGFRSYNYQSQLYTNYCNRDGQAAADTYSARPGYSEHQTGLAFDVNNVDDSFAGTPEANWLEKNAYKYGFIVRYPKNKQHITGYQYEPWHIRYLGIELATKVYNSGLTLEEYYGITSVYSN